MAEYISFDSHKRYTLAERENVTTGRTHQHRIAHQRGAIEAYLRLYEPGTAVAVEATGNWYWIIDEIEAAGDIPLLVNPHKAKAMMAMTNKTDKLDVHGLNRLQRNGTLPTVWIPPGELRDYRELTRTRMFVSHGGTRLKNRIHATLLKFGLQPPELSDLYVGKGRQWIDSNLIHLPSQARWCTELLLEQLHVIRSHLALYEQRIRQLVKQTPEMTLLKTIPGIGDILTSAIYLEIGQIGRFPTAQNYCSYSGTTPRVHSSGGRTRFGSLRPDVNHFLQWAYIEAANAVCLNQKNWSDRHAVHLYQKVRARRNHCKAIGAVARHLAESSFYVLTRGVPYRDPALATRSSQGGVSAVPS
jgi:transposase